MKVYRVRGIKTIQNLLIPNIPGVYFIWSKYELLYIGSSCNVRRRVAEHMSYAFLKEHIINPDEALKVSIMFTPDKFEALKIEEKLINLIPTKWNKRWFCKTDWYWDWRNGEGLFAEIEVKDKQQTNKLKGESEIIDR